MSAISKIHNVVSRCVRICFCSISPKLTHLLVQLFNRDAAQLVFPPLHLPTWIFDVELLLLARDLRIPVAEVPVQWVEIPGSKLNVAGASLGMLRDLAIMRANYLIGRWSPYDFTKED